MFSHRLLPEIAYQDPARFYSIIGSGAGQRYLLNLWDKGAEMIKRPSIPSDGLFGQMMGKMLAIIEFPRPQTAPESYFSIFVSVRGPNRLLVLPGSLRHFYYTLEMVADDGGGPRTKLCSLDEDCSQTDHGAGPAPNREALMEAVVAHIKNHS